MNKLAITIGLIVIGTLLYGGEKLDSLDKKTEEFYNNISKMEATTNETKESTTNKKTTKQIKTTTKENLDSPKEQAYVSPKQTSSHFQEENNKFQNLKISSIYLFNGKKYVVFSTPDADGRYTLNDTILGYTIDAINTRTKTISLSKEIDKNTKYFLDLSPEGTAWKKNH